MRVLTWNVHGCVGSDGRRESGRVAEVIERLRPQVAGLQEVDSRYEGACLQQVDELSKLTGIPAVAGPTIREERGAYGNALLTTLPVLEVRRHDISVAGREPRGILDVDLDWRGTTLRVLVTHMGLALGERRDQVGCLIELLDAYQRPATLVMGDLNEWAIWGSAARALRRRLGQRATPATFPARLPLLSLDRMWADPPRALAHLHAERGKPARRASDHLPLVGELHAGAL